MNEERARIVCALMQMARMAAESLLRDMGLEPGDTAKIGAYTIRGKDFGPIFIESLAKAN